MKKILIHQFIKILIYEVIKFLIAVVACYLTFSVIPVSVFLILFPIELIVLFLLRKKISINTWIEISAFVYLASVVASITWIVTGHSGLEFLTDFDKFR